MHSCEIAKIWELQVNYGELPQIVHIGVQLIDYSLSCIRDPRFIGKFKAIYGQEVWAEHVATKKKRKLWRRKDDKLSYPYEEK